MSREWAKIAPESTHKLNQLPDRDQFTRPNWFRSKDLFLPKNQLLIESYYVISIKLSTILNSPLSEPLYHLIYISCPTWL